MATKRGKASQGRSALLSNLIEGYVTMKYDLNVVLKNIDGQILVMQDTIQNEAGETVQINRPLTASEAIIKALTADLPANVTDSTEVKGAKYAIAKKIKASQPVAAVAAVEATETTPAVEAVEAQEGTTVSLKSEEVTTIKDAIGKLWGITTVGALLDIIEAE